MRATRLRWIAAVVTIEILVAPLAIASTLRVAFPP